MLKLSMDTLILDGELNSLLAIFNRYEPLVKEERRVATGQEKFFNIEKVKSCIADMAHLIIKDKMERNRLLDYLLSTDFYRAPASTRFHGDFQGGLCVHTLCVIYYCLKFAPIFIKEASLTFAFNALKYPAPFSNIENITGQNIAPDKRKELESLFDAMDESDMQFPPLQKKNKAVDIKNKNIEAQFTAESVFVMALCHDLCKINFYETSTRNAKDINGQWIKVPYYKVKEDNRNMGHGQESMLKLLELMPSFINKRWVLEAIFYHMGAMDLSNNEGMNYMTILTNPLVLLLQVADQAAAAWYNV